MSKEEYRNLNALASIALIIYLKEKQDLLVKEGDPVLAKHIATDVIDLLFERAKRSKT